MKKVHKKAYVKKEKKNVILHLFSFIFVVYFVYTMVNQQMQINKYDSQIDMYSSDIASKKELIEYYKNQKTNIQTDEYIESVARDTLGYVKPYEKIFVDVNR